VRAGGYVDSPRVSDETALHIDIDVPGEISCGIEIIPVAGGEVDGMILVRHTLSKSGDDACIVRYGAKRNFLKSRC